MPQRYVVVLFQAQPDYIHRHLIHDLQMQLNAAVKGAPKDAEIDLWLDSPGGSAHATYKLWLELRGRCSKLRAWIPDYAKSAATLLILGVDEIYMGPSAELGPLDVQIEHPDRENVTISALDVVGSLDYMSQFALQIAIAGGAVLVKCTELPRSEVLKRVLPFAAKFVEPCISKIDPHLTQHATSQLKVAEHYAKRMLRERQVPTEKKMSEADASSLVDRLVSKYPIHECVIGRDEARSLGLPVLDGEKEAAWPVLRVLYEKFMETEKSVLEVIPLNAVTKKNGSGKLQANTQKPDTSQALPETGEKKSKRSRAKERKGT